MVRKNDLIEFNIDRVAFPDKGEGEYEGQKVKFRGGIEGQKVEAKVSRKRKDYIETKVTNVLEKSPLEIEIGCPHFRVCGRCVFCKYFLEKVANSFSIVLHLHFPQYCKPISPPLPGGETDALQAAFPELSALLS